ncbi:hypothetical protein IE990_24010 [Klebsiella pneumoniae]|uniref:UPF0509 protein YciZ n=1 Tax=Klebsiella pneumoniae TaxID=573 RepID=A0A927DI48_KLEPN|nr:hypothetical protein [Klebsiella pneumoniae]MBD3704781.1 hypothetical protein [Klebsiella pneumoniae]
MSDVNAHLLAQRIDTVLDILVAGDYHSAIHNLEILKAELLALAADDAEQQKPTQGALGKSEYQPCRSRPYGPVARHIAP